MDKTLFNLNDYKGAEAPKILSVESIPTSAKVPIPAGTYNSIKGIRQHCNNCQRCPLGETRTHAVVGRGNRHAPVMVIGEAPGAQEDETGKPFVGAAGKVLERMLKKANLSTGKDGDVYIANIIKCRPPDNRVPTNKEIAACKPYLLEQIRLIDPKIIVLIGATAVRGLLGNRGGITRIRGTWMKWNRRFYMPILHPAYLLRNHDYSKDGPWRLTERDLKVVRKASQQLARTIKPVD
ncbi:phage SPO1 DNA polymerase-related protein [Crinalium epipsammum PCC 9333]|uniref:Type-4 uracil-DNA glycosylase n=1 Tax=Crinalium epipsammum PCC 9333 TaxID=1173022 RepID=K9VTI9_9CYAN|nr:uracil-DNA glycosylase [Crinalium epipsammum]AFZ11393.1 phage SPO1 DNA polymerase-related protein [Crinalium epipsammum PCC 9333]